ncbi:MAG TPA: hypothetical protein VH500_14665 [Nitrososphaeraceae archaeon]
MSWDNVIDKEVKSADKQDMGKVQSIARHYVEIKEGNNIKKTLLYSQILYPRI